MGSGSSSATVDERGLLREEVGVRKEPGPSSRRLDVTRSTRDVVYFFARRVQRGRFGSWNAFRSRKVPVYLLLTVRVYWHTYVGISLRVLLSFNTRCVRPIMRL